MQNEIPVLYVFNFKPEYIVNAIKRLNCSLTSILGQADKIFILNASNENIDIVKNDKIVYIHKPYNKYFNKAILINYMVKNFLSGYEYFVHSDVDLIYRADYIQRLKAYITDKPVRVMPRNVVIPMEYYSSKYDELMVIASKFKQHITGESKGNGLFHVPSLIKIRGFNERFLGYSPEDEEINLRLAQINNFIYAKEIDHVHLFHNPINREYRDNNKKVFKDSMSKLLKNDLIRNNENWGNY